MSTVLQSIIEGVLEDVAARALPMREIISRANEAAPLRGAESALRRARATGKLAIISEVKRASPSKGELALIADPAKLAAEYERAGASVVSVLTEARRFKGSLEDFASVRSEVSIPMLRKDFIASEYQVYESRAVGADLMLLIVAGLAPSQLRDFYQLGSELGMDILIEIHDEEELETALGLNPAIVGVNSRNLKSLAVDFSNFNRLLPLIPPEVIKVAESGISERAEVAAIEELGGDVILVGEALVKAASAGKAIANLLGFPA